ncbi:Serine/threonine-protein kinase [Haplosporangium sp. Z 27]|nr:Serine/threonine-protein kinase [Haplosporangium sp. Z 27]
MFKYRSGEYDPTTYISKIEDDHIKALIRHMIQLDPSKRFSAEQYLAEWRDRAFPKYFYTFLHQYIHSVTESAGESSSSTATDINIFLNNSDLPEVKPKTNADEKIERIYHDFDKISFFLGFNSPLSPGANGEGSSKSSSLTVQHTTGVKELQYSPNEGALIFLSLLCSSMRNTAYPSSKMHALDMLLSIGRHVADDIKLDRLVPYIVSCLSDEVGLVRAHALKTLAKMVRDDLDMLDEVETLDVINVTIFPEYILPALHAFPSDKEVLVRSAYASHIAQFAHTSLRFLELAQTNYDPTCQLLKNDGAFIGNEGDGEAEGSPYEATYDSALHDLQVVIEGQIRILLVDSDSSVKRALLSDMTSLCIFLGKQRVDDVLLSHMITYLNGRDWMLRSAFFESIVGVGTFVGGRSLEEYILPLMVQALTGKCHTDRKYLGCLDSEEFVVEKVLKSLASLCDLGLFQKMAIWDLVSVVAPLLCHPNLWIRYGAIGFISSTAQRLPVADVWCMIYPIIRPFMNSDVGEVNELHLRENVKPPLSRHVFEGSIQWAAVAKRTIFWKPMRERPTVTRSVSVSSGHSNTVPLDLQSGRSSQQPSLFSVEKSSEDENYLDKLRAIGMTIEDESKLTAMREYIWKLSRSRQSARPKGREDDLDGVAKDGSVILREIGITPRTVFLSPDNIEKDYNSLSKGYSQQGKTKVYDNTLLHPNRGIAKSNTTGNMPRISGDNTIVNSSRNKDSSSSSIYESTPFDPAAPGQSGANLYLQSASARQSTASFASSIAHSTFQSSSYGHPTVQSLPNSPESRNRLLASNIVMDKNSKRTRILLTPGNTVNSETGKVAAATSMNDTNALGTIELPANERTVQDVIAGSGVDIPKPTPPPWQLHFEAAYPGDILQHRGSENFGNRAFNHTVDGGQRNLYELLMHQTLKVFHSPSHEFGPNIIPLSRHRRMQRNNSQTVRSQWRPKGTLIAHLAEHKASVNQILVSPDHTFFVSCSDDGSVKIWDTARLEKNVTNRARMSYNALGGRVNCMSFIENTHSVAAASDNGLIHIFRVHYSAGKYGKCEVVRKITLNDEFAVAMEHYNTESQSLLVYATNRGNIHALELGTMRPAWNLKNNISHGVITAMVIDQHRAWLLVGTNRGVLTLWDLRFLIAIRSWVHPSKSRISRLVIHPEPHNPSRGGKVIIASGKNDVSVWDIEHVECCEVFGVRNADEKKAFSYDSFKATEPLSGSELLRNSFTSSDSNVSADQSVHAVIFPGDCEYMITGGADRKMRYWDMGRVEISYVISGNDSQDPPPKYATRRLEALSVHYEVIPSTSVKPKNNSGRANVITVQQQQLLRNHLDSIMDIAFTEFPSMMLISGDRDGVIKVFT